MATSRFATSCACTTTLTWPQQKDVDSSVAPSLLSSTLPLWPDAAFARTAIHCATKWPRHKCRQLSIVFPPEVAYACVSLCVWLCVCCTLMSCAQLHVNLLLHFAGSFFACHFSALADSCWTLSISCTGCLATWRSKGNYWIWGKAWVKDKCSHSCNSTWQMYCREFNMQWHGGNLTLASLKYAWQLHIIP